MTLLNIALFIGGTVYTGVQVDSIQKRYEEASIKISDAKQKYDQAETKLKSIQTFADQTSMTLADIERRAVELFRDLQKKAKDNSDQIEIAKSKSEQEFELLKKSSANILARMETIQNNTEASLTNAANSVALKLEREIQYNKEAIEKKQVGVDALGLLIAGLSAKVGEKSLDLKKVQIGLEEQLSTAVKLNHDFNKKIKSYTETNVVTVPLVFDATDIWLKAIIGFVFLCALLTLILTFRRLVS